MDRYCLNCGRPAEFKDLLFGVWFCKDPQCKAALASARVELRSHRVRRALGLFCEFSVSAILVLILLVVAFQRAGLADFTGIFR